MKTGKVQGTHAQVLHNLRVELSKMANLRDRLSSGTLVALAFMDVETEGFLGGCFGQVDSQYSLDDYLTKAKKVLAERPDLVELGRLIDSLDRLEERMKTTPENQMVDRAIIDIQALADSLDSTNTDKLATDIWDLEAKISALRNLIKKKSIQTA